MKRFYFFALFTALLVDQQSSYTETTATHYQILPTLQETVTSNSFKPKKATKTKTRKQRRHASGTLPEYLPRKQYLQYLADELGWVESNDPCAICGGYFEEPKILEQFPHPGSIKKEPTTITAKGPVTYASKGVTILKKDVVVTQPGRIVEADKAYIYRDSKTGKISKITLIGHVRMREAGKLIVADTGTLTLYPKTATLVNAAYHVYSKYSYTTTIKGPFNAWGTAKHATREASGIIRLKDATYTTCAPTDPAWQVHASRIVLDKKKGVGKAYGAVVMFKHIPLLATPYYSFPLNHERKTGFLTPKIGFSTRSGADFGFPFYWNMAPNYDLTITPEWLTKRGFELTTYFRYLSERSTGHIYINYLPYDPVFRQFRTTAYNTFSNAALYDQAFYAPYLNALQTMHNYRGFVTMKDDTRLNSEWTAHLNINYVTDPYYFSDISGTMGGFSTANQLLNQADLEYSGWHWQLKGLVQAYQTLHIINQTQNPALDQYQRLPDIIANAYYPDLSAPLDLYWNSEITNFSYQSNFTPNKPIGQRLHLRPGIGFPIYKAANYITPQLWLDTTSYNVEHIQPSQVSSASRVLPIFDIDTGFYFDRYFHLGHSEYTQTFEPRFFYLLVPYKNQDNLPNFDTVLLPFSFQQLFAMNRFTGDDRLDNANQISLGLTSRILNADTADPVLRGDIGFIYYFEDPKVCLSAGCTQPQYHISPIVSDLTYYPTKEWSLTGSFAWDPNLKQTNNAGLNINYNDHNNHIVSLGYVFVHENGTSIAITTATPPTNVYSNNTSQLTFSTIWPIVKKWSAVGYIDYNINRRRIDNLYAGLQYDTCCWALRLIMQRSYVSTTVNSDGSLHNAFDNSFYIQLQLKGLGDFGMANTSRLLSSTIPGFQD